MENKLKIYIDFDGVIANTIETIVSLYNEDFRYYKNFKKIEWFNVKTWDFSECNCASAEYINTYFNQPRFFKNIHLMDYVCFSLHLLNQEKYDITIVSSGYSPNLKAKEECIKKLFPFCKFIGVNLKYYKDKSHIDMSDGIFIDDSENNLITSNAKYKVCFGEIYPWNENWNGIRYKNWVDTVHYIIKEITEDENDRVTT